MSALQKTGFRLLAAGEAALVVELGETIDAAVNQRVHVLDAAIAAAKLAGVVETVPTYRSILVSFDPLATDAEALGAAIAAIAAGDLDHAAPSGRRWFIPVAFGGEYGFVNKLLPVWRFASDAGRLYVHPETGTLAARIGRADYAEGWTFAQLHKWQGLEFLGRWPRDLLQIAWALASASTAALGLRLFLLPAGPRRVPERTKRSRA